ncbi:MAG: glycosyltransferase, partial [Chloroflexi bacterium]|nr:glycosyltransferase [Chloroflexota bacterium]
MPDLSVSVVTYRTPALLRRCLTALAAERACLDLDVTVVDNASGDDTLQML